MKKKILIIMLFLFALTLFACSKKTQNAPVLMIDESGLVTWNNNKIHSYYICVNDEYSEIKDNKYQLAEYQNIKVKYLGNERYLESEWSNIVTYILYDKDSWDLESDSVKELLNNKLSSIDYLPYPLFIKRSSDWYVNEGKLYIDLDFNIDDNIQILKQTLLDNNYILNLNNEYINYDNKIKINIIENNKGACLDINSLDKKKLNSPGIYLYDGTAYFTMSNKSNTYIYKFNDEEKINTSTLIDIGENENISAKFVSNNDTYLDSDFNNKPLKDMYTREELNTCFFNNLSIDIFNAYENKEDLLGLYNNIDDVCYEFYKTRQVIVLENIKGAISLIDYSTYNLSQSDVIMVFNIYKNDHPFYFWISPNYYINDQFLAIINGNNYSNGNISKAYDNLIINNLEEIKELTGDLGDEEKIIYVYNYILSKIDNKTISTKETMHNVVGLFENYEGNCETYAKSFSLILNYLGIKCYVVNGKYDNGVKQIDHAWNLVELNNQQFWYDLDGASLSVPLYKCLKIEESSISENYTLSEEFKKLLK